MLVSQKRFSKMCDDEIVLNYHNSLLRKSDVDLLKNPHCWLNDRLIGFWFEYLENSNLNDSSLCLICPEVAQFIKLGELAETSAFVDPLDLNSRSLVLLPVNDSMSLDHPGGSHWSLLVYDCFAKKSYHFDSLIGSNLNHAKKIAYNLNLSKEFSEVRCTQQQNSYDCGVFVCCNAENVVKYCSVNKGELKSLPLLSIDVFENQRNHMLQVVTTLSCK